ncbi:hypothetical protein MKX01_004202 [Papaver californicum]|nr:hypothetical protein MKX01_004202 [Papaver californicum]
MTSCSPSSSILSPSYSLHPQIHTRSSLFLGYHPFNKTQQDKLILLATLSLCSRNVEIPSNLDNIHDEVMPTKPFRENQFLGQEDNGGLTTTLHKVETFIVEDKRNSEQSRVIDSVAVEQIKRLDSFDSYGGGFTNLQDFNNLLMGLVKEDETEYAVKMFDEMSMYSLVPDSKTYSIMIRCYCKKNDAEKAKGVLDEMVKNGFHPNVVTMTVLINSFCRRGKLKKAVEVFDIMGKIGCEPTVQTYNCLINGLCYVGRVEEAYELLMKIKKSPKKPDIYTYTAVMDGYCKVGRSDEAMELLEEALAEGLKPNVVTFNTLFNGYCKEGRAIEGINLLDKMKERNCEPDYISYSTLLHGLLKWNEVEAALRVYKEMLEIGFEVSERMINTFLRVICRRSWTDQKLLIDVEQVLERIKESGLIPYPNTYCMVIQTLSIGGEAEKALTNLHKMMKLGYRPRLITLNAVIRALCKKGMVDEGFLVLVLMVDGNIRDNKLSYNLLIDEFNRRERLLDACKVYGVAVKRGVIPNHEPIQLLKE